MGEPPSFEHTIDRLDNSKGYQPDNCRWATMKEQARNRTNNVQMTFNGETKCLGEWAEQYQISYSTIRKRFEDGWKPSRVLGIEPGPHLYTYNGESKSITEWAKHYNMPVNRLHYRLTNGWSFEDAVSKPCGRTYTYNGETMSVSDWAKRLNVTANVLFGRLNNGQTFDSIVEKILKSEK